jgi:hypothetical protein
MARSRSRRRPQPVADPRDATRLRAAVARNDRTIAMVLGFVIGAFVVLDGLRGL